MSRYIDADKALQCAIEEKRFFIHFEDAFNQQFVANTIYSDLADFLNSQPTADVVEVVRCRDCRYRARRGGIFGHYACTILGGRYVRELPVDDRFFCYYGERKVQE